MRLEAAGEKQIIQHPVMKNVKTVVAQTQTVSKS